jgi:peptide/nickel transport system permease protein
MTTAPIAADTLGPGAPVAASSSHGLGRRLLKSPVAIGCLAFLAIVVGIAIVAPIALPNVASEHAGDLLSARQGPSWDHPLGTDTLGRDELNRLLVGTRPAMVGVAEMVLVVLAIGVPVGLAAGYLGGWVDRSVGWLTDLSLSLPVIAIALVVLSIFRGSMLAAMVTIGALSALPLARVVRSATLPIRQELYISAAQVAGLSRSYIISRHLLPRVAGVVIVLAALSAATALLVQTGLAYLGLINPAPEPSWGGMVAEGTQQIIQQPWLIWPAGVAITLTILAFGLLGDTVRDATAETWSASSRRARPRPKQAAAVAAAPTTSDALLSIEGLTVTFPSPNGPVRVVEDVSFDIGEGEAVGVVGESGCGKTVTAMSILGLLPGQGEIESGRITLAGRDLTALSEQRLRKLRGREIGLVSQEPMVGLNPDEPTTALDVTVQAEILELLRELQHKQGMAILLVSHDWNVVRTLCERAVVMYAGQVVERANLGSLLERPLHPYTEALLASSPQAAVDADELPTIRGEVPRPDAWPTGCRFNPRCRYATDECRARPVPLERPAPGRETRCIHYEELLS